MKGTIIGLIIAVGVIIPVGFIVTPYLTQSSIDEELPANIDTSAYDTRTIEPITEEKIEEMIEEKIEEMMGEMASESAPVTSDEPIISDIEDMKSDQMVSDAGDSADAKDMESEEPAVIEPQNTENLTADQAKVEAIPAEEVESVTGDASDAEPEMTVRIYSGEFVGVGDGIHDAQGFTRVLPLDDGSQILRLEEFRSTNGPDLYVYLATDKQASDFVNLGSLKANQGNQNYEIPDGTDLSKYDHVLIWCKPFHVLFGSSQLSAQP